MPESKKNNNNNLIKFPVQLNVSIIIFMLYRINLNLLINILY